MAEVTQLVSSQSQPVVETPNPPASQTTSDQPKPNRLPLMKSVSVFAQMYKWQPTGLRVTMKLPLVGDDKSFLFCYRVSPLIPTPQMCRTVYVRSANTYGNLFPLRHSIANAGTPYINIKPSPISFIQHSPPPISSNLAMSHARWRGGMSFQLRTTSQFTNQANVFIMSTPPTHFQPRIMQGNTVTTQTGDAPAYTQSVEPTVDFGTTYPTSMQGNHYMNMDLSVQRHAEFTVPFNQPVPYVHQAAFTSLCNDISGAVDPFISQYSNNNCYNNFWAMGLKGGIDAGSGPQEISFEIYQKLEPDFEFADFTGFVPLLDDVTEQSFLTDYNMAPGKNPIIFPSDVTNTATVWSLPS